MHKLELQLGKKLPFWERHLDIVILTQPQSDHLNALNGIFKSYSIGRCISAEATDDSAVYQKLMGTVEEMAIAHSEVRYPQQVQLSPEVYLQVIHPPEALLQCKSGGADCNNLVLRLVYREISFLYTADIDGLTEDYLAQQRAQIDCTVLKVAHHGSRNSSTAGFLTIASPDAAVISAGKDNSYGHPHPETLARLYEHVAEEYVFTTAENGTVEFISDGDRLWVKTEK